MRAQRIRRALVGQDPTGVVVEEEELVVERGEALLPAVAGGVVCREVPGREPRHHADRGADVEPERGRLLVRRALLPRRVRQLVAAKRRHVEAEVAHQVEGAVEALVGVSLGGERPHELAPLLEDLPLEVVPHALDRRTILLLEIQVLERRVELDERRADPRVERLGVPAHAGPRDASADLSSALSPARR